MARKDITDRQVLHAYTEAKARNVAARPIVWPEDVLRETTGEPIKVCYAAMERASDRGLIEYGVSLRSGWLTPEGEAMLAAA